MNIREKNWNNLNKKCFDVAIIGGGINGVSVYKRLCEEWILNYQTEFSMAMNYRAFS
ncbi:MAG: hypothetical protein JRJ68_07925 [Deltaproteobacteria bacterium]|nr:hypothetical protein [Deltaproteobacteria bacterium]